MLKGGQKDVSPFMMQHYLKYAVEMKQMSQNPIQVWLNDQMYYVVHCHWFWIADAPAKHVLCGWMVLTALYGVLPQIRFYNLFIILDDTIEEEEVKFITKNNWSCLLQVQRYYTPRQYKDLKETCSMDIDCDIDIDIEMFDDEKAEDMQQSIDYFKGEVAGVLLDEELNEEYCSLINDHMEQEEFSHLVSREEQYQERFNYCKNVLKQPQLYSPLSYSLHPIMSLLHMHKTVVVHCCVEVVNYFLSKDDTIDICFIRDEFNKIAAHSLKKKMNNWFDSNTKYNKKKQKIVRKSNVSSLTFTNLNKRQTFQLFIAMFPWILLMDKHSTRPATHYFVSWCMVVRVRIVQCILIHVKKDFKKPIQTVQKLKALNRTLLHLIFPYFPHSV